MSTRNPGFWSAFWGTASAGCNMVHTFAKRADQSFDPIGKSMVVKANAFLAETVEECAQDTIDRRKRLDASPELKSVCEEIMASLDD